MKCRTLGVVNEQDATKVKKRKNIGPLIGPSCESIKRPIIGPSIGPTLGPIGRERTKTLRAIGPDLPHAFQNEMLANPVIGPSTGPQKGPHETTVGKKIQPKEITWDNMGLSTDPRSVLSSDGKAKKSNHLVILYGDDT